MVHGSLLRAVVRLCGKHANHGRLDLDGAEKVFADAGYKPSAAADAAARLFQSTAIGQSGTLDLAQLAAHIKCEPALKHRLKDLMDNDSELAECEKTLRPVFCKYIRGDGRLDVCGLEKLLADPALPVSAAARNDAITHVPEVMSALDSQKRGSLSLSDFAEFVIDSDKFHASNSPAAAAASPKKAAQASTPSPTHLHRKFHTAKRSEEEAVPPHQQPTPATASAAPIPTTVTASVSKPVPSVAAYHVTVSPATHRLLPQSSAPVTSAGSEVTSSIDPPQSEPKPGALPVPPFHLTPNHQQPPETLVPTPSPAVQPMTHTHEAIGTPFATIHELRPAEYHPEARVQQPLPSGDASPAAQAKPPTTARGGSESGLQLPRLSREAVPAPSPSPSASPAAALFEGVLEGCDAQKEEAPSIASDREHIASSQSFAGQEPAAPSQRQPDVAPHEAQGPSPRALPKDATASSAGAGAPSVTVQPASNVCGSLGAKEKPPPSAAPSLSHSAANTLSKAASAGKSLGGSMGRLLERGAAIVYGALGVAQPPSAQQPLNSQTQPAQPHAP